MENMDYSPEELVPIAAELAAKYTGYEHSSITYEKAQMLMEGILYCIGEYEQNSSNLLVLNRPSAREAYKRGQEIVIDKTRKLHDLYNELIMDFQDYGSECLKDTVTKQIPEFLLKYDFKFAPSETVITPDYPIPRDLSTLSGIDFMLEYMEHIRLEQQFLKKMDTGHVIEILRAYHSNYEALIENICEIVRQAV